MSVRWLKGLGVAGAAVLGLMGAGAQANEYFAGTVSEPGAWSYFRSGLNGEFQDSYHFTIGEGSAYSFSFLADQGAATRYWVDFSDAGLYRGDELLASATGVRDSVFSWLNLGTVQLGAGDYQLRLKGEGGGVPQFGGGMFTASLTMDPAPTPPVPEAGTTAMLALGLGLMGVVLRRGRVGRRAVQASGAPARTLG